MPCPLTIRPSKVGKPKPAGDDTRALILDAALQIFSRDGISGARTEEIASVAGVNKALLYYYFKDKDALHGAVLEHAMAQTAPRLMAAIEAAASPRDQLLAYVDAHFDAIAQRPRLARLMQHEIMRAVEGKSSHLKLLAERFQGPLIRRVQQILEDGVSAGDFRELNVRQATLSVIGTVVFYFLCAPVIEAMSGADPLAPEALAVRKVAVIDFISHAVFSPARNEETS